MAIKPNYVISHFAKPKNSPTDSVLARSLQCFWFLAYGLLTTPASSRYPGGRRGRKNEC